ncbi:DNA alkylation repair protein [uncultured Flavobacterium sp.]|uniref:DNA alkylation repair protein n=1 Tax=uncultured Flavobacterium sp. TaxID=165435 RepID=UPI0025F8545D|nr:DNA alkylation repair protein [uncultured Flavobacterium sp.]
MMKLSETAESILLDIESGAARMGDLRKIAKEIKKDHKLGMELWGTGKFHPMLLAILIFDAKSLGFDAVDRLLEDIDRHDGDDRLQLADWLMANQLLKDKKLAAQVQSWQDDPAPLKRRIFWYHQARLRWTGQVPPNNTAGLMEAIENSIAGESPEVQWAMNFTAGWIGVFDTLYRNQCITIGEKLGLYKDEMVAKNCTPSYLPKFIEIEANKREL